MKVVSPWGVGSLPTRRTESVTRAAVVTSYTDTSPTKTPMQKCTKPTLNNNVDELVQVELGAVPSDPDALARLVPADRLGLRADEQVEVATGRVGQGRDA